MASKMMNVSAFGISDLWKVMNVSAFLHPQPLQINECFSFWHLRLWKVMNVSAFSTSDHWESLIAVPRGRGAGVLWKRFGRSLAMLWLCWGYAGKCDYGTYYCYFYICIVAMFRFLLKFTYIAGSVPQLTPRAPVNGN